MAPSEELRNMSLDKNDIADLDEEGEWVSIEAKVLQLWKANSDSISQVGLIGDETGKIKFVSWEKGGLPDLEEGNCYRIKGAVVDSWNGDYQVNLNSRTSVEEMEEEVEVSDRESLEDKIVGIVPKSGYIERCPECKRVLVNDHCPVHIEVDPLEDLRVKASLQNSDKIAVFNGEQAEELLDMTLDESKEIEEDDMEPLIYGKLVGKKLKIKGREFEENIVVNGFEEVGE
ncbi:MAG: replication factor A [Thermoplasmatota archaeon]